ncbi:glycoside hydrolase family 3 C-terminal domain-containing protein [Bifidobacterium sp. B4001]|uniref:glycoside hydrolase family 3 C-terminal domain-containing protein n=1 Tax=Bifidobacterium TaxID=1678 RepID=UPI001C6997FF|nr:MULTISPECIES: glycoside hydrolase family 3 N-terminal domain-containing protein [Bifidobacterium]MCX8673613.1 glycoside hydrolase family 3 C-terminal domain-containing protein [Bifidobacterium sp. B4079]MCX8682092.1 glycoside hydrolase family 3 C-terminal domain-containing protein [Bifidobacterium sp. B4001]QYN59666.1 beta-glucosidase [Bifidobacterium asteroides]
MFSVNLSDVVAVLKSLIPQLVVIGVFLVLALLITIAVNKHTVKTVANRKMIHSQSWLVAFVAVVAALATMLLGPLSNLITKSTNKHELQPATVAAARNLAEDIQRESVTMLQNSDGTLPLKSNKVNVFGWASTNPVYGGTGSGSMSADNPTTSLLDGISSAGLKTNKELSDFYTKYRADRPKVEMFAQDWTLPEPTADKYTSKLMDDAKQFSDTAVVVIGRVGGEGADLPKDMRAKDITYHDNDKANPDFKEGQSFLELSKPESDMIAKVASSFNKVVLVYNGANTFNLNFVGQYPQIKSVLWCPPPGQAGFTALGEVLKGKVNPSGKTSDTFVRDLTKTPTYNNFGSFTYTNMDDHKASFTGFTGKPETSTPTFVDYNEGIYVGYRFWETAAKEGLINYDQMVQYPFGYGLSYTTFSQKMGPIHHADGKISFDVTVTNTGAKAGRDTVQTYFEPPYVNGGIEKASANLVSFKKTKTLDPGKSQTITVNFKDEDMASYDADHAKAYVLDQGDYGISIRSDSHRPIQSDTVNIAQTVTYDKSNPRSVDKVAATNRFDDAKGTVTYLSRANHFANYQDAVAAPKSTELPEEAKAHFYNNSNYDPKKFDNDSDKMPTTGAKNNVRLYQLRDKKYDDPMWDKLLDQLNVKDMDSLIAMSGYGTQAVKGIGKIELTDADGPAALNNNFTKVGSLGFPSSTSLACTWNPGLATRYGEMIGTMAHDMDVSGWYAPAFNIHRSAFSGRNFEYFSEDPEINAVMGSNEVAAARSKGVYAFMKHFAMNDQETNRTNMLATWANEQTIREIYLKPFQAAVVKGGAQAAMSSFNYIGTTYVAAYAPLMQDVLRGEWGFRGMVLTDYFGVYGYQNADQLIRNGNDAMLATTEVTNHVKDKSATSVKAMRQASHNILYTVVHGYKYANGDPKVQTPAWQIALYVALVVLALIFLALEYLAFRRFKARRSAVDVGTLSDLADDARKTRAQDPASMESTPSEDSSNQGPTA